MNVSEIFPKVAIKRLTRVETDASKSHQHELNGVNALKRIFGSVKGKKRYPAKFVFITDDSGSVDSPVSVTVSDDSEHVTWYDARENHPHRTEYRLYYSSEMLLEHASEGDLLVIAFDGTHVWMIVAETGSTAEKQLMWLFTKHPDVNTSERFAIFETKPSSPVLSEIERKLLEEIGVELYEFTEIDTEKLIREFNGRFPTTKEFSAYARMESGITSSADDPDFVLLQWWNTEEKLFRALEKHIVNDRLKAGFRDVDDFIEFAKSVINRRNSRAGHAFENHLEQIFIDHKICYDRGKTTEKKSKPDFLFPSALLYKHAIECSNNETKRKITECLTVLGAKTTCRDRWRQVTKEADLIETKHLVTLEPSISEDQTDEMRRTNVQLILPAPVFETYTVKQQMWLWNIKIFINHVQEKQNNKICINFIKDLHK